MKAELRRITVLVTPVEYEEIQRLADGRPLSKWIRKQILQPVERKLDRKQFKVYPQEFAQPESEKGNGSANHQDVQRVPERKVSGRRTPASGRRTVRGTQTHTLGVSPKVVTGAIGATVKLADLSGLTDLVTKENFSEMMAGRPLAEVDVWARSLPRSVLPGHDAASHRLTCMCSTCLEWRRTNAIPYGGAPKKESRWAK